MSDLPVSVVRRTCEELAEELLSRRTSEGIWRGRLSDSALATATAVSALASAGLSDDARAIRQGTEWLLADQNADGGWGDSPESPSNLSTTLLTLAALSLAGVESEASAKAMAFVCRHAGAAPSHWAKALRQTYGRDRTFAAPILMNLAIAHLVPWKMVPRLPFELAALPPGSYRLLRLHVVSYALPALIAIGARVASERGRLWLLRPLRERSLRRLPPLQPEHGGFLDAIPLTSFVAMALAGLSDPPGDVLSQCLSFIRSRQRADGAWPIDTDLATWLTTAAAEALHSAGALTSGDASALATWLLRTQHRELHPYTQAQPGGWAWTDLAGGVPDADDTSGALIALGRAAATGATTDTMALGARWLLSLQNGDGGFPTFCRGWGRLPFDQSAPEVTAHAIRALTAAASRTDADVQGAIARAMRYLDDTQDSRGHWRPLWFGSQHTRDHASRTIGAARVLRALEDARDAAPPHLARRSVTWLLETQSPDGGWGADEGIPPTVEETALAVSALCGWRDLPQVAAAAEAGVRFLLRARAAGALSRPAPIGLYFSSLWYSEQLYPLIWTLEALGRWCGSPGERVSAAGRCQVPIHPISP
jgi:squalene-hopene/tetraprenyl-beta-curcumene cyclase